jgi:hypothetical protein
MNERAKHLVQKMGVVVFASAALSGVSAAMAVAAQASPTQPNVDAAPVVQSGVMPSQLAQWGNWRNWHNANSWGNGWHNWGNGWHNWGNGWHNWHNGWHNWHNGLWVNVHI